MADTDTDLSKAFSDLLSQESVVYENLADHLSSFAMTLRESANTISPLSYDLKARADKARVASHNSQSFSFDPKPPPTNEDFANVESRIDEAAKRAVSVDDISQSITSQLTELIQTLQSLSQPLPAVGPVIVHNSKSILELVAQRAAEIVVEKTLELRPHPETSTDSHNTYLAEDYGDGSCFPLRCRGNRHVPTCSTAVFQPRTVLPDQFQVVTAKDDPTPEEPESESQDTTLAESDTSHDLVESIEKDPMSDEDLHRRVSRQDVSRAAHRISDRLRASKYKVAKHPRARKSIRVAVQTPHYAREPLAWIPDNIKMPTVSQVFASYGPLEAHPYGF